MVDAAPQEQNYRTPPVNERGRAYDPDATDDERTFALLMHLTLLAHVVLTGLAIIAPIIMWNIKKESSPFLDDHGREAINFQITLIIYSILVIPIAIITCGIGALLMFLPYILGIIGMIQGSIAANRGEFYRYPMCFRFV